MAGHRRILFCPYKAGAALVGLLYARTADVPDYECRHPHPGVGLDTPSILAHNLFPGK